MRTTATPMLALKKALARPLAPLSSRDFRWYWMGNLTSYLGMGFRDVTTGWLVYHLTGSAMALGWVNSAWGISTLILAPFGGVAADRLEKRKLIALARTGVASTLLITAFLVALGRIQVWHLFVGMLCIAAVFCVDMPARQTMMAELVSRAGLLGAIGLDYMAMHFTSIIGPAIAGYSIGVIGAKGAFFAGSACYALAAAAILAISPRPKRTESRSSSALGSIVSGLRYVRREPQLLTLLAMGLGSVIFGSAIYGLMPVFAQDVYRAGAMGLGLMSTTQGVGALVGSLAIASLGNIPRKGLLLMALTLLNGLTMLAFAAARPYYLGLLVLVLVGFTRGAHLALNNGLLQTNSSDEMRGRIMGLYMMTWGLQSISLIPIGMVADSIGAPLTVGISGLILLAIVGATALLRPQLKEAT